MKNELVELYLNTNLEREREREREREKKKTLAIGSVYGVEFFFTAELKFSKKSIIHSQFLFIIFEKILHSFLIDNSRMLFFEYISMRFFF